jgi:carbon-monoxide dehydrogenase small subunit
MKQLIELNVNGQVYEVEIEPWRTLLEVIRDRLELTGTKESCSDGHCGTCAVLLDNKVVNACLVLAIEAQGKQIMTIEGMAEGSKLHPIQEAFVEHGAIQCGFCTPGMVMATKAFLDENPHPTDEEIKQALAGHLCRCTGYFQIIEAVRAAADKLARGKEVA